MSSIKQVQGSSERGVTLVEALVAIALIGVVASAVMGSVGTSLQLSKLAVERSVATGLAAERLHRLGSIPFQSDLSHADYALGEETVSGVSPEYTFTTAYGDIPDHPDYSRTLVLTYDTPDTGMMKAEATITWNNLNQGEKNHTLITYIHPDLERQQ